MTLEEAIARYGPIENNAWANETKWMVFLNLSAPFASTLRNEVDGKLIKHLYVNKDMAPALQCALDNIYYRNLLNELKTYGGCLMIRDIRGMPGKLSTHGYGLGLDFNTKENPLGSDGAFTDAFGKCFTDAGFKWGKFFLRKDPMHFQFNADW